MSSSNKLQLSIIIPVYNSEKYIVECLDSINKITSISYEVILVNDGSTDHSKVIVEEYSENHSNVKVVNKENGGVSSARNLGILTAVGEYITFVDSDDWIDATELENLMNVVMKEQKEVYIANYTEVTADNEVIKVIELFHNIVREREVLDTMFLGGHELNVCWGKIYKRAFLLDSNIVFDMSMKIGEDTVFTADVLNKADSVLCLPMNLYFYRQLSNNTMNTYRSKLTHQYITDIEKVINKKKEYIKNQNVNSKVKQLFYSHYIAFVSASIHLSMKDKSPWKKKIEGINNLVANKEIQALFREGNCYVGLKRKVLCKLLTYKFFIPCYVLGKGVWYKIF